MSKMVGIDVGATGVVVTRASGDPLNPVVEKTLTFPTTNVFPTDMDRLEATLKGVGVEDADAVGMAVAGLLSAKRNKLRGAGNITSWIGQPLAAYMRDMVGPDKPLILGNDGEAAALYEAYNNPALQGVDFLYFGVGTGIAVARIAWFGGKPYSLPTEGSHVKVHGNPSPKNPVICGCGQFDCIERLGSGSGIEERFEVHPSVLNDAGWNEVAYWQARGIAAALTNHPVETVVYGGGVAEKQPQLLKQVQTWLDKVHVGAMNALLVPAVGTKQAGGLAGLMLLTLAA